MPVVHGDKLTIEAALFYAQSVGWNDQEAWLLVQDVKRTGPLTMARLREENNRRRAALGG